MSSGEPEFLTRGRDLASTMTIWESLLRDFAVARVGNGEEPGKASLNAYRDATSLLEYFEHLKHWSQG
jgi:hypothetical protein